MIRQYATFTPNGNSETGEHLSCAAWLKHHHPDRWQWIFHCPSEGKRKPQYAAMLASMGFKPGIPDLIDLDGQRGIIGMFELKKCDKKARPTKEQNVFLLNNAQAGGFSAVCWGFDQFVIAYSDYLEYCLVHGAQ